MEGKAFVFKHRDRMYYYREYEDGTSNVYPLMPSPVSGVLYLDWNELASPTRLILSMTEWILYPDYKLGWMVFSYSDQRFVRIRIVLYRNEYISNCKKTMMFTVDDCLDYAYEHAVSTGKTMVIEGVGTIYESNGCVHIGRQPSPDPWLF